MTEITTIFRQMREEDIQFNLDFIKNAPKTEKNKKFNEKYFYSVRKENDKDAEMIETFANFAHINSIKEMMQLGIDGVKYGNCENAYDNLYRIARKCFKGNKKREHFASSTLYYFWQNFAFDKGLMCCHNIKNGVETITPVDGARIA